MLALLFALPLTACGGASGASPSISDAVSDSENIFPGGSDFSSDVSDDSDSYGSDSSFVGSAFEESDSGETEEFTLFFDTDGGSELSAVRYKPGEKLLPPEQPQKEGFVFIGWYSDGAGTQTFDFSGSVMPSADLTVYAKWRERQKDIKINLHLNFPDGKTDEALHVIQNEGEALDETGIPEALAQLAAGYYENYLLSEKVDLVAEPVYIFDGWACDPEGAEAFGGVIPQSGSGAVELYARWRRSPAYCSVTFILPEGVEGLVCYVLKNTAVSEAALKRAETLIGERCAAAGYGTDGLYTSEGVPFAPGETIFSDIELYLRTYLLT